MVRLNEMKDTKKVLFVEDDRELLDEYEEVISSPEYSVDVATDLPEALAKIKRKTYHVAVIDIGLDQADHDNRDGIKIIEYLHGLGEGTRAVVISAQRNVEVLIDAYEKYEIAQYLEKRKVRRPSDLRAAIEKAYSECRIRGYGAYGSVTSFLSGEKNPTSWEHSCLRILRPAGGITGLYSFFSDFCGSYTPLLAKKAAATSPMQLRESEGCVSGTFWSKGIGEAVSLVAYPKDSSVGKSVEEEMEQADSQQLHGTYEKANVTGVAFTLSRADREDFVESI